MNKLKIIAARLLRGEILNVLYNERPRGLRESTLKKALIGDYSNIEIERELAYLEGEGKEYISYRKGGEGLEETDVIVDITSRGQDLIEGSIPPDPGISFREEGV